MKRPAVFLFRAVFFLLSLQVCQAQVIAPNTLLPQSVWTRGKGTLYVQAGIQATLPVRTTSNTLFGLRYLHRKVMEYSLPLYAEYGIIDRLTISASLPLRLVATGSRTWEAPADARHRPPADTLPSGTLLGLGNAALGLRVKLLDIKGVVLSAQVAAAAPATGLQRRSHLLTGYPAWGFAAALHTGFAAKNWYVQGGGGMVFRTHGYNHQWTADLEMGYRVKQGAQLSWSLLSRFSLGAGRSIPFDADNTIHTGLYINHQNYFGWMFKWYVPLSAQRSWGIGGFLSGGFLMENILQTPAAGVSVFYHRQR